jgi:hypothetical protein
MTLVLIIIGAVAVLAVLFFVGGYAVSRRRAENWHENVAKAERALEVAWAQDKGWDRELLHRSAREALGSHKPGFEYTDVHLVVVEDRPGVVEDRAQLVAVGEDGEARVVLARDADGGWRVESVS